MHSDLEHDEPEDPRDPAIAARLRRLPSELSPPFDFPELQRRARAQGRSLRAQRLERYAWMRRGLAAAASFALLVLAAALWVRERTPDHAAAPRGSVAASGPTAHAATVEARARDAGDDSERWLASLPAAPAIVHVDTRLAVTDLEDRIASVDDLLTAARFERTLGSHLQTLQRERAQLVDSLVQVRYAETLAAQP